MPLKNEFNVYSSNGHLIVNAETGIVNKSKSAYDNESLVDIIMFDLDEYKEYWGDAIEENDHIDILDLACWDGYTYEEADDYHRSMINLDMTAIPVNEETYNTLNK